MIKSVTDIAKRRRNRWFGATLTSITTIAAFAAPAQAVDIRSVIAETVKSNPLVLAELRETDARDRQVRQALAGYYPTLDLIAGYGFQERDPANRTFAKPDRTRNELERRELQLSARQLVFDGFYTPYENKNQQARQRSAQFRATSVGEDISLSVTRVFLDVLKQEAILKLAKETLDYHQSVFDRMGERFQSGVGSRADFDQISSRLALARANLQNVSANLRNARINYQQVVGSFPQDGSLEFPGSYNKYLPADVEAAVGRATENHPIMKVAETDLEATGYTYEQTKSSFYPRFDVEVERDLNDNIDGSEEQVDDLRVMLRMRYNLYRGGADQARTQEFAHLVEKAKEIRNNARREVEEEVRLAWVAHDTLVAQIPVLLQYVDGAESTKAAYVDQFDLGRRTLLDLLNTENEAVNAKRDLINAKHDLMLNEYRIFHGMGDLMATVGASL
ncbi:MAG TPA: TolC family outer membrane protein [Porticoccaceae bacterium]|nr:TolC family outer membrane protein [Porticoccaceae bacterium]